MRCIEDLCAIELIILRLLIKSAYLERKAFEELGCIFNIPAISTSKLKCKARFVSAQENVLEIDGNGNARSWKYSVFTCN